jgi:hypothetical protein
MLKIVDSIEKILVRVLIVFMLLAITLGTLELGRVLIIEILSLPFLLLDFESLFEAFGLVLVILIGIELFRDPYRLDRGTLSSVWYAASAPECEQLQSACVRRTHRL